MITIELLWKATAILAATFAVCAAQRQSTAALRHFIWTVAFAALLLLPVGLKTTPKWDAPVEGWPVPSQAPGVVTGGGNTTAARGGRGGAREAMPGMARKARPAPREAAATAGPAISLSTFWWIGFGLVAARFLAGAARTAWMVRSASELERRGRVRIVASAAAPMPMTWGIVRPVVLLPHDAAGWPADRIEVVLTHELTHVLRRDLLAQTIAQAACCLYWFHPLAWLALRELRKEREQACDDGVLRTGVPAHEYASHLMEMARSLAARRGSLADAPAMADTSCLESRIRILLDRGRNRSPLRRRGVLAVAAVAIAALLPLSSINVFAQVGHGTVTGIVKDPSDARVPGCKVTAKQLDSGEEHTTTADMTGEYRFASIPSGRYRITFAAPGFKMHWKEITLVAGAVDKVDMFIEVGTVKEAVRVSGGPRPPVAPRAATATPNSAERLRIGGNVQQVRLIRQPKPIYPEELKQQGIEGVVTMVAIIGKNGKIQDLTVRKAPDPRLAKAAMESVWQWEYEPARLNGMPIEVMTEIDVEYSLGK